MEMAYRHGIEAWVSEADYEKLQQNPPAWLLQSRANRTGKKAVWVELSCDVCGYTESARPKKWWPTVNFLSCSTHNIDELPAEPDGFTRREVDGIGTRFIGIVDEWRDNS